MHHGLEQAADRFGDRDAVRAGDDRVVVPGARRRSSNAFARHLAGRGVGAGDRVAVMMANRVEFVVAVHAISKLGAAAVLLSPAWKAVEVGHAVELTAPVHAVADGEATAVLGDRLGPEHVTDLDDRAVLDAALGGDRARRPSGDGHDTDESVLVFSSGTTGLPEGGAPHARARWGTRRATGCRRSASVPTTGSRWPRRPSHILGLLNLLAAAAAGATVRLHRRFDLDEVLHRIETERMTLEMAVAPIALAMANHPTLEDYDLSSLRYIMWGATPVSESVARGRHRAHGRAVAARLRGQRAAGDRRATRSTVPAAWRLDSAGLPPEGVELRVADLETGEVLPPARPARSRSAARRSWPATSRRRRPPRPSPTAGTAPATSAGSSPRAGSTSPTAPRR